MQATQADHDAETVAAATYFTAVRFTGRGRYDRVEKNTLDAVRRAVSGRGGPWMIYAVAHPDHDRRRLAHEIHVETI